MVYTVALVATDRQLLTRLVDAQERIAKATEDLVDEQKETNKQWKEYNERIGSKELGVYMNPNMKDDRYKGRQTVSEAAFDVSMEETEKVDDVVERIRNPINWNHKAFGNASSN